MYDVLSVRSFSTMLGFIEIGTAVLIALRSASPWASAVGGVLAIGLFATTLSFLISTPGWEPSLGFPALSAMPGQFLLKDIVYLGASIWLETRPIRHDRGRMIEVASILTTAITWLQSQVPHRDPGALYFACIDEERTAKHLARRMKGRGYEVQIHKTA
jgi:hypothetical protein